MMRRTSLQFLIAVAVGGSAIGPVELMAQGSASKGRLTLKGYDPVAYFTLTKPTPGVAEYEYVYDGVRYRFANARHRDLFKANPEKYRAAIRRLLRHEHVERRHAAKPIPTIWVISNGNLYVFAGAGWRRALPPGS